MKDFTQKFTEAYKNVATAGEYSMTKAKEVGYGNEVKAIDMPKTMSDGIERIGGGCCFQYSWKLIYELDKVGIKSYWAMVPEPSVGNPKAQKCVVVYETPDGSRFVADVIEEVKAGVKLADYVGETCQRITQKGEIVDNSRLDLKQTARDSWNPIIQDGYLKIFPSPNQVQSFSEYWKTGECERIEA